MDSALKLAPLFSAVRLISDTISSLPLQAYREAGDIRSPFALPKLFDAPSIYGGTYEWSQRALISLLLRGNAYGLITEFDAVGYPRAMEWVHPDDVSINETMQGRPQYMLSGKEITPWIGRDSGGQLLHIPLFPLPGRVEGLSPVQAFRSTVELGLYAERFGSDFFKNGAVPSGVLETDQEIATKEEAELVKARFKAGAQGRDVALLTRNLKYRPITVNPEDSQFILTRESVATTVAAIYGVPAEMIGGKAGGSLTYSSPEQNSRHLVTHTLRPYATKLENAFSTLLPRPQYVRFNFDALLRPDTKARYEAYQLALTGGWLTLDEVRTLEDLPPLPEEPKPEPTPEPPKEADPLTQLAEEVITSNGH
jgi:HK97 family phage portal protein